MNSVRIRPLAHGEWQAYRDIRLQALRLDPDAFSTTAHEAERWSDADWQARLRGRAAFVAEADGRLVGLVSGIDESETAERVVRGGAAELISMWVQPGWRGRGVGERLVEAVATWASEAGFALLRLWVADGNDHAERLYVRCGFSRTGERQPLGRGALNEFAMERKLQSATD